MGDKEATPVEDPEVLLTQMEPKQPEQSGEQPEVPTSKGEVNLQEALRPVSYTHLDVYKRQHAYILHIGII